jgi:hypothetical protein
MEGRVADHVPTNAESTAGMETSARLAMCAMQRWIVYGDERLIGIDVNT